MRYSLLAFALVFLSFEASAARYRAVRFGRSSTGPGTTVTAGSPPRQHSIETGASIESSAGGHYLFNHKSVFVGPKDTPPPPNPTAGASGRNAVTPNSNPKDPKPEGKGKKSDDDD